MPVYRVLVPQLGHLHLREWRRRLLHTVGLLLGTLAACAIGLSALGSANQLLRDRMFLGLWNSLNLITTVGDFTSLDEREKVFMMATMIVFLIIGGYALSTLTGFFSSSAVMTLRENKDVQQKLERLANHVIVVGFGVLGRLVASRLHEAGEDVVIIERTDDLATEASNLGYLVVQGDAGVSDDVLDHSRIEQAKALVVTTEDPDRKLAITLMAHSRNARLKIAVTGASSSRGALLQRAGASEVVLTEDLIAGALVDRLSKGT